MMANHRRAAAGTVALLGGYLAVTGLLLWGTAGAMSALRVSGGPDIGAELALAAAVGAWVLLTWLTAVTLAAVLTALVAGIGSGAHRRALRLVPPVTQRLVAALLGLTVVAGPVAFAGPTAAAERSTATTTSAPVASADRDPSHLAGGVSPVAAPAGPQPMPSLDRPIAGPPPPGWTPDRPATVHRRSRTHESAVRLISAGRGRDAVDEVVVRRGDTLWDIAARHLGPHVSAADIAREWPHWYAANRTVIGADPDLLLPGQRLVPPRP